MRHLLSSLFFVFSFSSHVSVAQVITRIKMKQKDSLEFQIEVENRSGRTIDLDLTKEARLLDPKVFIKPTSDFPDKISWKVKPRSSFKISYSFSASFDQFHFKSSNDFWIPVVRQSPEQQKFYFQSQLLPGFEVVQSATGSNQDSWALAFGRFSSYFSTDKKIRVFLLKPDPELAQKLIARLVDYMTRFEEQIGPYPYDSFSVVEAPDEIGFAFPKMTWIGSQLLRFPFILTTSLPHELLHSWWGNGVFVDYKSGNWCEGLTSFGADYALLDDAGKKLYRMKALSQYENYVKDGKEISLSEFVSRGEDRALQAIGYDKALMVFVMVEQQIGEQAFKKALKSFYSHHKFKRASYDDLFNEFQKASGQRFQKFKDFWIHSKGSLLSPILTAKLHMDSKKSIQWIIQEKESVKIPKQPLQVQLLNEFDKSTQRLSLQVNESGTGLLFSSVPILPDQPEPSAYQVDPDFYLFRKLNPVEKPVVFSSLFGSNRIFNDSLTSDLTSTLRLQFPDMEIENQKWNTSSKGTYLFSLDSALNTKEFVTFFEKNQFQVSNQKVVYQGREYLLAENAFFASLRVGTSQVFVIHLPSTLSVQRWIQRWVRYGGQSYLVLGNNSAAVQGVWLEPFWVRF